MKIVIAAFLALVFFSCSAYQPPKPRVIERDRAYLKTYDQVWASLIEWFAQHGTPVKNMDKASGFIATDYSLSTGQMNCLDCGKSGQALWLIQRLEDPRGNFNILVKQETDSTVKVSVNCFFKATSNIYDGNTLARTQVLNCASTGRLERTILDYIGQGITPIKTNDSATKLNNSAGSGTKPRAGGDE